VHGDYFAVLVGFLAQHKNTENRAWLKICQFINLLPFFFKYKNSTEYTTDFSLHMK